MKEIILNNINPIDFTAYYILAVIGLSFSLFLEAYDTKTKVNIKDWFKENKKRIIINLVTIVFGVLFTENISGVELNSYTSFLAGFTTDKIIKVLNNKK